MWSERCRHSLQTDCSVRLSCPVCSPLYALCLEPFWLLRSLSWLDVTGQVGTTDRKMRAVVRLSHSRFRSLSCNGSAIWTRSVLAPRRMVIRQPCSSSCFTPKLPPRSRTVSTHLLRKDDRSINARLSIAQGLVDRIAQCKKGTTLQLAMAASLDPPQGPADADGAKAIDFAGSVDSNNELPSPETLKSSLESIALGLRHVPARCTASIRRPGGGERQEEGNSRLGEGEGEEKRVTWCHRMKSTRDHAEVPELMDLLGLDGHGKKDGEAEAMKQGAGGERKGHGTRHGEPDQRHEGRRPESARGTGEGERGREGKGEAANSRL